VADLPRPFRHHTRCLPLSSAMATTTTEK
jgi:hypothetical protein